MECKARMAAWIIHSALGLTATINRQLETDLSGSVRSYMLRLRTFEMWRIRIPNVSEEPPAPIIRQWGAVGSSTELQDVTSHKTVILILLPYNDIKSVHICMYVLHERLFTYQQQTRQRCETLRFYLTNLKLCTETRWQSFMGFARLTTLSATLQEK
jgi:hypothetical protein